MLFLGIDLGMDAFARALIIADNILQKTDYKNISEERYASFDNGKGKELKDEKLSMEDLRNYAIENGERKLEVQIGIF